MKTFNRFFGLTFGLILLLVSCNLEIGLGKTVDTLPPELSIKKPDPSTVAVIRDEFAISGVFKDDGTIKDISVDLTKIDSTDKKTKTYNVDFVQPEKNVEAVWSCVVNPDEDKLLDGTYNVTVTIKDNGGHTIRASSQIVIDNTPPVIILQRPSSNSKTEISDIDTYGQTFTLEGMAADDNDVARIEVNVFEDADCINLLDTIPLYNVPPTIELDVSKWGQEAYNKIYGSNEKVGAKQLYCTIVAYDSAQRYPSDGANQTAEDLKGNSTDAYYLYEDVINLINEYKTTGLYHIMNGTFTSSTPDRSADSIISITKESLKTKETKIGSFSLNPNNNPTFTVNGKSPLLDSEMDFETTDEFDITNGSEVTIEITPGLDNIPIDYVKADDNLKVYAIECDKNAKKISNARKIYLTAKETKKSGSNYKITVPLSTQTNADLEVGKFYLFGVDGADTSGNTVESSAVTGFGFKLASAGSAPSLTITAPASSITYFKKGADVVIEGYTFVEDGKPVITATYSASEDDEIDWTPATGIPLTYDGKIGNKHRYSFSFVVPAEKFSQDISQSYDLYINSTLNGKATSAYRNVMYDVQGPEINVTQINPSPIAFEDYTEAAGSALNTNKEEYINGIYNVKGNILDAFSSVKTVTWSVIQNNQPVAGLGGTISSAINFNLDTSKLADKKQAAVVIEAVDAAGNLTKETMLYFVDQSTDKPLLKAQEGTGWTADILNPNYITKHAGEEGDYNILSAGGNLNSSVSDDDGVRFVKYQVKAVNATDEAGTPGAGTESYTVNTERTNNLADSIKLSVKKLKGDPTSTITAHQLPGEAGFYEITQTVYDKNFVTAVTDGEPTAADEAKEENENHFAVKKFVIKISGVAPTLRLTRETAYVSTIASTELKVHLEITGEAPFTIKRSLYKVGSTDSVLTEIATAYNSTTYDDTFSIENVDFEKDITYVVTDGTGAASTPYQLKYTVDNDAPQTLEINSPKTDTSAIKELSLSGADASIRGNARDSASGVSKLLYQFTAASVETAPTTGYEELDVGDGIWNVNIELGTGSGTNTATKLYEGSYKLWVIAEDNAGNKTEAICRRFDVDQAGPDLTNLHADKQTVAEDLPAEFYYSDTSSTSLELSGKILETNGLVEFKVNGNNVGTLSSYVGTTAKDWTYTLTDLEKDTANTVTIYVKDAVGREKTLNFTVFNDTKKPALSITSPDKDLEGEDSISIDHYTFRASADDTGSGLNGYKYIITQTDWTELQAFANVKGASPDANWVSGTGTSLSVTKYTTDNPETGKLHAGTWFMYVYAKDKAGNEAIAKRKFWVDLHNPELTFETISSPRNTAITIEGTAYDKNDIAELKLVIPEIKVQDADENLVSYEEILELTSGSYSKTFTVNGNQTFDSDDKLTGFADGSYTLQMIAKDNAGKETVIIQNVIVDYTAPTGTVSVPNENYKDASDNLWYKSNQVKVNVATTDATSGIDTVYGKIFAPSTVVNVNPTEAEYSLKDGKTELYPKTVTEGGVTKTVYENSIETTGEGENVVYVEIKDKAGNIRVVSGGSIFIDTTAPVTLTATEDGEELAGSAKTNGKTERTIIVTPADYTGDDGEHPIVNSGIKAVTYKAGSLTLEPAVNQSGVAAGSYKFVIPANTATTKYQVSTGKFEVEDNAGNKATLAPFTFEVDETSPTVTISEIADAFTQADGDLTANIDVNGELTVSGTASDDNKVKEVYVKYYVDSTGIGANSVVWDGDTPTTGIVTVKAEGTTSWTTTIDTTGLADKRNLYIKAYAYDAAGNIGTKEGLTAGAAEAKATVFVNQDSDRPIISFNNFDLSNKETVALTNVNTIYGSIKDDDGTVKSFSYVDRKENEAPVHTVTVTNGSWSIAGIADGQHIFEFKVVDAKDKNFESKSTTNKLKFRDSNSVLYTDYDDSSFVIDFRVDKESPDYSEVRYSTYNDATSTWSAYSLADVLYFGGDYTKFNLQLKVSDENGIKSVKIKFNNVTYDEPEITLIGTETKEQALASDVEHLWTFKDIPTADLNGLKQIELEIEDNSGLKKNDKFNITIDNEAPGVNFGVSQGKTVYATDVNELNGTVVGSDLAKWCYIINESSTAPDYSDFADGEGNENLLPLGTSFLLSFDGTELPTLFNKICEMENITADTLKTDDVTRQIYLWVYATDNAGNKSEPAGLMLNVIPNGDKPTVSFGYPAKLAERLGGIIRLTGSSKTQTDSVRAVYLQIDPNPTVDGENVSVSADWEEHLLSAIQIAYGTNDGNGNITPDSSKEITNVFTNYTADTGKTGDYKAGIRASGTTDSWNLALNEYKELNHSEKVAIRAFAVSSTNGKLSQFAETWFTMDPNAPEVGSRIPLELVQFEAGHVGEVDSDNNFTHITNRQNYETDMWIQGEWYLIGSIDDDAGIQKITYSKNGGQVVELVSKVIPPADTIDNYVGKQSTDPVYSKYVIPIEIAEKEVLNREDNTPYLDGDSNPVKDKVYNFNICIPVGEASGTDFGELTYQLNATEGTSIGAATEPVIKVKFDNRPPRFAVTTGDVETKKTAAEKLALDIGSTVQDIVNYSGNYTFYGVLDEESEIDASNKEKSQSGFSRIVFYFTRDIDGVTYLIDPMLTPDDSDNDGRANFITASGADTLFDAYKSVSDGGDGLYWFKEQTGTVENSSTITLSSISDYIRKGGIAKINGIIYSIKNVDYANKQVTIQGTLKNGSVKVSFAAAQIVDHIQNESGTTAKFDKLKDLSSSPNYDDGDQMIEGVSSSGTTYTWKASIDSSLILDGEIKMHFVAFDAAGNATEKTYTGNVKNNAPRLYGVKYGTDENGDNDVSGTEWKTNYSHQYSVLIDGADTPEDTSDDEYIYGYVKNGSANVEKTEIEIAERLTVKGTTKVVPQVVGGNVGLGYTITYKKNPTDSDEAKVTKPITAYAGVGHSNNGKPRYDTDAGENNLAITLSVADFLDFPINDGNQTFEFDVWDKTDGKTAGTNSYSAKVKLPVKVAVQDTEAPTVKLLPFHWTNETDNSLYNNNKANGHIELEADLPVKNFSLYGTGVYDFDPKVSGVITIEGVATDNVRVDEIVINIPGYTGTPKFVRDSDGVSWKADPVANKVEETTSELTTDWAFQLVDDTYSETDGTNTVNFKLHFNTAKMNDVAKANVLVTATAKDKGKAIKNLDSTIGHTPNESTANVTSDTYGNVDQSKLWYKDADCTQAIVSDSATVYKAEETTYGAAKNDTTKQYYLDAALTQVPPTATSSGITATTTVYTTESATYGTVKTDGNNWYTDTALTIPVVKININNGGTYYKVVSDTYGNVKNDGNTWYTTEDRTGYPAAGGDDIVYYYTNTTLGNALTGGTYYVNENKTTPIQLVSDDTVVQYRSGNYNYNSTAKYSEAVTKVYQGNKNNIWIQNTNRGTRATNDASTAVYGPQTCTLAEAIENNRTYYSNVELTTEIHKAVATDDTTVFRVKQCSYGTDDTGFGGDTDKYYLDAALTQPAIDDTLDTSDATTVYRLVQTTYSAITDTSKDYYTDAGLTNKGVVGDSTTVYYAKAYTYGSVKSDGNTYYLDAALTQAVIAQPADDATVYRFNQTTEEVNTQFYRMDVVPYIREISTRLDDAYESNTSVFNRSANGGYPVLRNERDVKVYGYNFNGTSTIVRFNGNSVGTVTSNTGYVSFNVPAAATSGHVEVEVSTIKSLNNVNNDSVEYNKEANGTNNNTLTDTRRVYVWGTNQVVTNNTVRYPSFRIGKDNNQSVGFIYDAGGTQIKKYLNGDNILDTSYSQWFASACAVDEAGHIYGAGQNGDSGGSYGNISDSSRYPNFKLYAFADITTSPNYTTNGGAYSQGGCSVALEWDNVSGTFYPERIQNPKIAVSGSNATKIAMVYYDKGTSELRFRYGTASYAGTTITFGGAVQGRATNTSSATGYQTITSGTSAGEYAAVGIIPANANGAGTVVICWYDAATHSLKYKYNTNPTGNTWSDEKIIDSDYAGEFCDLAVDANGGVHMAYFRAGGKLKYAYLESYSAEKADVCVVDSFLSVGTNISIETSSRTITKSGKTRYIPYISYFTDAIKMAKVAWPVRLGTNEKSSNANTFTNGVSTDMFTGSWEVQVIPTSLTTTILNYTIGVGEKSNTVDNSVMLGYGTKTGLETALLY